MRSFVIVINLLCKSDDIGNGAFTCTLIGTIEVSPFAAKDMSGIAILIPVTTIMSAMILLVAFLALVTLIIGFYLFAYCILKSVRKQHFVFF
jgi:hypothetical protein